MAYERYHISTKTWPNQASPVPKFVITRADNCINCGKCERSCIFGVHKRSEQDPRKMADPVNALCKNCFMCIQECPQRALTMMPGTDYRELGRGVWTSLRVSTIWGESETGKIPVLGAGYRGMFAGPGYDGMWTDMSEIVRPTRDGIHGREFISTSVDIGSKPSALEFGKDGGLQTHVPQIIEIQVPIVMDSTRLRGLTSKMLAGWSNAARNLDTLMFAAPAVVSEEIHGAQINHFVPVYPDGTDVRTILVPNGVRMAELQYTPSWREDAKRFKSMYPHTLLAMRVRSGKGVEKQVLDMAKAKIEVAHIDFDDEGMELDSHAPRHAKDSLRAVHKTLVSKSVRDQITIIAAGGIAAAEHIPKTLICGADVVAMERALLVAIECRNCVTCSMGSCPASLISVQPDWIEGRVTNLVGAWRDQLLEVLGAMGIREVRRLRGELGRAIFYDDVETEAFSDIGGGDDNG